MLCCCHCPLELDVLLHPSNQLRDAHGGVIQGMLPGPCQEQGTGSHPRDRWHLGDIPVLLLCVPVIPAFPSAHSGTALTPAEDFQDPSMALVGGLGLERSQCLPFQSHLKQFPPVTEGVTLPCSILAVLTTTYKQIQENGKLGFSINILSGK